MDTKTENQKIKFEKNKPSLKRNFQKDYGINIIKFEFIENNKVFDELTLNLPRIENAIMTEYSDIHSVVQIAHNNKYKLKYHNCITFYLPDGSHLRFSPYKEGLELSRLYIEKENQNQGYGTLLMEIFLGFLENVLEEVPEIMAEITGAVGYGDTLQNNNIDDQLRFYEKFGFITASSGKNSKVLVRPRGLRS